MYGSSSIAARSTVSFQISLLNQSLTDQAHSDGAALFGSGTGALTSGGLLYVFLRRFGFLPPIKGGGVRCCGGDWKKLQGGGTGALLPK